MKKVLFIIFCFSFLQGCSQKKEMNTINDMVSNNEITAKNFIDKVISEVKHYPSEPVYIMSYDMYYTHFELYVDDMPAFKQFNHSLGGTADDINHVLFKKGKHRHTVKYKMYPVGKTEDGDVYDTFPDFTYLKLRLKSYDLQNEKDRKGKQYMEHRTPYTMVNITPYDKGERFVATMSPKYFS